jgi:hypothetical protein
MRAIQRRNKLYPRNRQHSGKLMPVFVRMSTTKMSYYIKGQIPHLHQSIHPLSAQHLRIMNRASTYAVYSHHNGVDDAPKKIVVFKGPKEALDFLKIQRAEHYDGGNFIVLNTASERDAFPYRNKIGPLRDDDSNHWGYRFQVPNTADVVAVWMEKREVGPGISTLKDDLEEEMVAEWVKRCKCDYVVYSAAQGGLDRAHGRHYGEDKEDFVFDAELEEESGEQVTSAGQVVEDVKQKDGQPEDAKEEAEKQENVAMQVVEDVEQKYDQPEDLKEEARKQETAVRQVVEDAE